MSETCESRSRHAAVRSLGARSRCGGVAAASAVAGQRAAPAAPSRRPMPRHAGRPSRSAGHLRPRHADAARAAGGHGTAVLTDEEAAKLEQAGRRAQRTRGAADRRRSRRAAERRRRIDRRRRQRRRLQQLLARSRHALRRSSTAQKRTSIVVDPPDGRVPPLTAEARQRSRRAAARADVGRSSESDDPGLEARPAPTTIPSAVRSASAACSGSARRPGRRRCRTTSTTTSTRSCRRRTRHDPHRDGPRRAHHPDERAAPAADDPQVDGRFDRPLGRRHAGRRHHELHRQDAVPRLHRQPARRRALHARRRARRCSTGSRSRIRTTWTQPWTGEYTWPATDELLYEYACHEGNYALGNILRGARQREAKREAAREQVN